MQKPKNIQSLCWILLVIFFGKLRLDWDLTEKLEWSLGSVQVQAETVRVEIQVLGQFQETKQ